MKRFLLHVVSRVVIINFFILCLILISFFKSSGITYDQYQKKTFKIKNLEVGVYGDSHIKGGVDTKIINDKNEVSITQFSSDGLPLFYTTRMVQNHLNQNSNLKCIIDLGTNNLDTSFNLEGGKFSKVGYTTHLSNNYHFLSFKEIFSFFKRYPFLTLQSIIKGSYQTNSYFNSGVNLSNKMISESDKNDFDKIRFKYDSIRKIKREIELNFEIKKLIELVKKNPSSQFLILSPPEHPLYQKISNSSRRLSKLLFELEKFKNVRTINGSHIFESDSLYKDYSHLNNFGRVKFSNWLNNNSVFIEFLNHK